MKFAYKNKKEVLNTPLVKGYHLAQVDQCEIVELTVLPGGDVPQHSLSVHVTFFVIEGEGLLIVNGEEMQVMVGDVLAVEADQLRGWQNTSANTLKLLAIKNRS